MKTIIINENLSIPFHEIDISHAYAGGPGGQNVNKLNTKVFLRWHLSQSISLSEDLRLRIAQEARSYLTKNGDLLFSSTRFRTQPQNIQDCIEKLRKEIEKAFVVKKERRKTKMPRGIKERILKQKKQKGEKKKWRSKVKNHD